MASPASAPAVRARGLVKRFGARVALAGVELEVAAGSLHGLLGRNGAGKTTLLRAMFGLLAPDAGSIELFGTAPAIGAPGVAGFVESPAFYPYLSARANLELLSALDDPPADATMLSETLERVGLGPRADDRIAGYSTGMRQRLGIAAALLRSPRLLLLDEPTSGLDPAGSRAVGVLLRELASSGAAVLVSSHQIGELEALCDAHSIMHEGRVAWTGAAARLADHAPAPTHRLSTSDDAGAARAALDVSGLEVERLVTGLRVTARQPALDGYVLALGRYGIAVRSLAPEHGSLERLFFSLTGDA